MKSIFRLNDIALYADMADWGKLFSPVYAYIELTKTCNCNCDFCQVENLHNNKLDMSFHLFKKIIRQLKKHNFLELRFGGGEPLLAKNFKKMVKYVNKKKFMFWICTNGILLDEKMAEFLKSNGCIGARISIDSIDEKKHNEVRRNNIAFKSAWRAVENCKKHKLEAVVSMTIGPHNIMEIEQLEKMAKEKNANFITHPIMPVGRGESFKEKNDYFCHSEKVQDLIEKSSGEKHCVAGTEMIAIDATGNVSPCTFIKPKYNLKDYSLKNIFEKPDFKKYKYPIEGSNKCLNCEKVNCDKKINCIYSDLCRGGCWALMEKDDEN